MQGTSNGPNSVLELIIGSIAGILGVSGFGYQLYKMMKTHETKAMTYPMMAFLGIGIAMWAMYGISTYDPIIYVTNIAMTGILIGMVVYKIKSEKSTMIQTQVQNNSLKDIPNLSKKTRNIPRPSR